MIPDEIAGVTPDDVAPAADEDLETPGEDAPSVFDTPAPALVNDSQVTPSPGVDDPVISSDDATSIPGDTAPATPGEDASVALGVLGDSRQ